MPLATPIAVVLILVGTTAAARGYRANRLTALVATGVGTVMLGMLIIPDITGAAAAGLSLVLLLPFVVRLSVPQLRRTIGPRGSRSRLSMAMTAADIEFMAIGMLLMPTHRPVEPVRADPITPSMSGMAGMAPAATEVAAAVIIMWALCVTALAVPLIRGAPRHGTQHAICSGTMILAMAVVML